MSFLTFSKTVNKLFSSFPTFSTFLAAVIFVALTASCSKDKHFLIEGKMADGSAHIIEMTYFENGTVKKVTTNSDDKGNWSFEGESEEPILAFIAVSGNLPAATVVVQNGDKITIEIPNASATSGVNVAGNKTSELLAQFDQETYKAIAAGKKTDINARVEDFIKKNPQEMASAVLLISRFESRGNEVLADSLLSLISPDVRPQSIMQNFSATIANQLSAESRADLQAMALYDRRDTTIRYSPQRQSYTLLAFTDARRDMRDSIIPRLRSLRERWTEKNLAAIEVSLALDSALWKHSVEADSATWIQAWAPGTVASASFRKLAVARVPFFIVADSTGRQLYRGSSLREAQNIINRNLTVKTDTLTNAR